MSDVITPDIYTETHPKANKVHRCCECYIATVNNQICWCMSETLAVKICQMLNDEKEAEL